MDTAYTMQLCIFSCLWTCVYQHFECKLRNGTCVDLFHRKCPPGSRYTLTGCGFLQICCVEPKSSTASLSFTDNCGRSSNDKLPGQVLFTKSGLPFCSGVLVQQSWALTAAHCFSGQYTALENVTAIIGENGQNVFHAQPVDYIIHGGYSGDRFDNDLALVKLNNFSSNAPHYKQTACIPDGSLDFTPLYCTATLHRNITNGTPYVRKVSIPMVDQQRCELFYGVPILPNEICGGLSNAERNVCSISDGSPILCQYGKRWTAMGLATNGCGSVVRLRGPEKFLNVQFYSEWMKKAVSSYGQRRQ